MDYTVFPTLDEISLAVDFLILYVQFHLFEGGVFVIFNVTHFHSQMSSNVLITFEVKQQLQFSKRASGDLTIS